MSQPASRLPEDSGHRAAEHVHGWRPGWIWAIPVAAIGIVGWLAVRSWVQTGPAVEVIFPVIADLRPGDTKVTFESYDVGQVQDVHLEPNLRHMRAKLDLNPDMAGHLGPGTQFWIIGKTMSLADLSAIRTLVSGVSVGISPRPGRQQKRYQGLAQAPVLGYGETGTAVTLHAATLGSVQRGTPVYYRGERVGEVDDVRMTDRHGFDISAFIDAPHDRLVHDASRFWRAGPVHLATGGNGVSLQFQSIPALFQGAIAFETPSGAASGPVAAAGHGFTLYDGEDAAENAPDREGVAYRVVFRDASGVPDPDAPVRLLGKRVGSVMDSALVYRPAAGQVEVTATIELQPRDVALGDGASWTDPRAQMDDMLRRLVARGLRASLAAAPPVIGGQEVSLSIVPGQPGTLGPGPIPEIPAIAGGGGISAIIAQAGDVVAKVNQMPLSQIADNLRDISRQIARLTGSPALAATLRQVDRSTANLQRITGAVDRDLPPALGELRRTVAEAQSSLAAMRDLLSVRGTAASVPGSEALPQTLYQITRTARALRELSDFLDRHPSAVLVGRGDSQ